MKTEQVITRQVSVGWAPTLSLLVAAGILLLGIGLLFTALGLRAGLADFSTATTGLVMSAYFGGFVIGTYICPRLIRRAGHIRAFSAMASIASTTAIVHAMWVEPVVWALLRLITGICLVGLYMALESWLNVIAPSSARGRVFSAYMAVTLVAMAIGQYLVLAGDVLGFVPLGLVSILLSLALVPVAFTRTPEPAPSDPPKLGLKRLYSMSPLGFVGAVASGLLNGAFYGMGAVFAQRIGLSAFGVAAFMSATILGGALLQWPVGQASDRYDRRRVMTLVCALAAVLALGARLVADESNPGLFVVGFLYGGLVFSVYGLSVALVNDRVSSEQALEASGGLLLVHGIGAAIGPAAAGFFMDEVGPGSLLVYFALVLVACAGFGMWRLRVGEPVPVEQQTGFVPLASSSHAALEMDPRVDEAAAGR